MGAARGSVIQPSKFSGGTLALVCAVALWGTPLASRAQHLQTDAPPASTPDTGEYNRLIEQAVLHFKAREFDSARDMFEAAHALNPSARTLRGLGLTDFECGRYALAIGELERALNETHKPLDATQRSEVQAVIAHAHTFVGTLEVQLNPSDATLSVDGVAAAPGALLVDAGNHLLHGRAPGFVDAEWRVEVRPGETTSTTLTLEAEPPPETPPPIVLNPTEPYDATQRTAGWIVGGVGVAGVVLGSVFGVISIVKHNESDKYCQKDNVCEDVRGVDAMDAARTAGDVSTVAFVVGGVALASAAVLLLTAPEERETSARIGIGPGGVSLRGVF
ncbi:MAG TPA: PEGA domain-containing protein [Polyangiales bacterium]|nr:PEGA domain-containing protein [Polyangiales bacterium]